VPNQKLIVVADADAVLHRENLKDMSVVAAVAGKRNSREQDFVAVAVAVVVVVVVVAAAAAVQAGQTDQSVLQAVVAQVARTDLHSELAAASAAAAADPVDSQTDSELVVGSSSWHQKGTWAA